VAKAFPTFAPSCDEAVMALEPGWQFWMMPCRGGGRCGASCLPPLAEPVRRGCHRPHQHTHTHTHTHRFIAADQIVSRRGVVDVGRCGQHRTDQARSLIYAQVCLVPKVEPFLPGRSANGCRDRLMAGSPPTPPGSRSHPASCRAS
jgi:hypothetical protein